MCNKAPSILLVLCQSERERLNANLPGSRLYFIILMTDTYRKAAEIFIVSLQILVFLGGINYCGQKYFEVQCLDLRIFIRQDIVELLFFLPLEAEHCWQRFKHNLSNTV